MVISHFHCPFRNQTYLQLLYALQNKLTVSEDKDEDKENNNDQDKNDDEDKNDDKDNNNAEDKDSTALPPPPESL